MQPFFVDLGDPLADNRIQNDLSRTESAAALAIDREPEEKGLLMKHFYPDYVKPFRCIAADCPDSCCQGWDVVIDEDTEAYYRTVEGGLGEKIRNAIYTDSDGDRVFRLADKKKCPFWGEDKLCDVYRALGEEHLCATCAHFPRITMDYGEFVEHSLALACPEAARLIVGCGNAYGEFSQPDLSDHADYDIEVMRFLLQTRREAADILKSDKPLEKRFIELKAHAKAAQQKLTGSICDGDIADVYAELEYIDESSRAVITRAAKETPDFSRYKAALTNLALYWLYRYLLTAIDTLDLLAPTRFLITSVGIVANLAKESGDITAAAQMYSKEIEQSYENMEELIRS